VVRREYCLTPQAESGRRRRDPAGPRSRQRARASRSSRRRCGSSSTGTVAAGINTAGDIVGQWSDAAASHGFLLQAWVFTPINFPRATSTTAFGINDTGEIAGYYPDAAGNTHGFLYALRPSAQWTLQAPAVLNWHASSTEERLRASIPTP
jgi:uncharacterized membrane protein